MNYPYMFNVGNQYLIKEEYTKAIEVFQRVLEIEPFCKEAHNNLGVAYLRLGHTQEAIRSFSNVLRLDETHEEARHNLAAVLLQEGRYREASRQYEEIVKFRPDDLDACYNLGVALMPQGRLEQAKLCFERVLKIQPDYCDAHINLAAVFVKLEQHEAAVRHYHTVLKLQPEHPFADYMVQALTGAGLPLMAPPAYVKYLFDNYASFFDDHVQKILQYETPQKLKALFIRHCAHTPIEKSFAVLDLGCGTGLSGAVFRDMAHYLVGIDLSPKMLAIARTKNIYDALYDEDITTKNWGNSTFDLVIAADVLVYLGDLERVFH
ncbi:MAG: tetratricopeptide repeat protein, partial [Gammaproteobacteria bacterium]